MKKIILQQAFEELNDAIAYYEEQQAGLGLRLKDEVDQHVNWILGNSTVPQIRRGGYRRVNLRIFPYYIAYIIRENTLWILAIAHGHRKPEYWIKRKNEISYRDRSDPHRPPLPHHAAYGSVLRDSADQAESDPGKHKPK